MNANQLSEKYKAKYNAKFARKFESTEQLTHDLIRWLHVDNAEAIPAPRSPAITQVFFAKESHISFASWVHELWRIRKLNSNVVIVYVGPDTYDIVAFRLQPNASPKAIREEVRTVVIDLGANYWVAGISGMKGDEREGFRIPPYVPVLTDEALEVDVAKFVNPAVWFDKIRHRKDKIMFIE